MAKLHLIPVSLAEAGVIPFSQTHGMAVLDTIRSLRHFVCENARTARRMLASAEMPVPIQEITFIEIPRDAKPEDWRNMLSPCLDKISPIDIGLLSEAGCPAVADPGALLVEAAYAAGITVVPHVGPSSILLAVMASGMSGQSFAFVGYLPQEANARIAQIQALEKHSASMRQTQVFIETPYRNTALLAALAKNCKPSTRIGVCIDLTSPTEWCQTRKARAWLSDVPSLDKRQAIFTLMA